jgi:endoglucanase
LLEAADLLRVLPVTNRIIELHYKEGHIDYNGVRPDGTYEPQTENRVYYSSLVSASAVTDVSRYSVTSPDDSQYGSFRNPLRSGYKALGSEFNGPGRDPEYLREYKVYLELPSAMTAGNTYAVEVGNLAENLNAFSFTYNEKTCRSPAIKISQIGFTPAAPKYAYFSMWMGSFPGSGLDLSQYTDGPFMICDARTGEAVKTYPSVTLQKNASQEDRGGQNWTRADIYSLDFSDFTTPGRYRVVANDIGCSYPFEINEDVYREPFRAAMRAMYCQRQGIVKHLYEYNKEYPRAHHPDINEFVYGAVSGEGGGISDPRPVSGIWGWYADAGDWDAYTPHWKVPFSMFLAYDANAENHKDGDVGSKWKEKPGDAWIEEGINGIPDILDEGRWLVDYSRRARHALIDQGIGSGGVPGYAGRDADAHFQPSWNDSRQMYVNTENTGNTYLYAGAAAYLAHCLNKFHRLSGGSGNHPQSAGWLTEARQAFQWAEGRGGAQDQRRCAVVCLYVATGESAWQSMARSMGLPCRLDDVGLSEQQIAACIYTVSARGMSNLDASFYEGIKSDVVGQANSVIDNVNSTSFRFGGVGPYQSMDMNLLTIPRMLYPMAAYETTGEKKYIDGIHTTMAYLYGGNQDNVSRVTGIGFQREQAAFVCDAWYLLDFNHIAYRNPIFAGYSVYNTMIFDVGGPGNEWWARSSLIPAADTWPIGERRPRSRYSIAGSEFTIHQNNIWYNAITGYLLDGRGETTFTRPTVRIAIHPEDRVGLDAPFPLTAAVSPSTERVEYHYDWHFAGESRERTDGFLFWWDVSQTGLRAGDEVQITAIAFDDRGRKSIPSEEGETLVVIAENTVVGVRMPEGYSPQQEQPLYPASAVIDEKVFLSLYTLQGRFVTAVPVGSLASNAAALQDGTYIVKNPVDGSSTVMSVVNTAVLAAGIHGLK